MSAKTTVNRYIVTPATVQANVNAGIYVANEGLILAAAATKAAALIAAGEPQGAVVAALVPVIQAQVAAFPAELQAATVVAQLAFV